MASLFVFYISIGALMFVKCQANQVEQLEDTRPNTFILKECPHRHQRAVINDTGINATSMKNSTEQPRPTDVRLIPKPGYEFLPSTVSVRRCGGRCECGSTPDPINTKEKSYSVQIHRKGNHSSDMECGVVNVMEHTMCKCMCSKKTLPYPIIQFYILGMLRYLIPCKDCHQMDHQKPHEIYAIHECGSQPSENNKMQSESERQRENEWQFDRRNRLAVVQLLDEYVTLIPELDSMYYSPPGVIVKRCTGVSNSLLKVVPKKSRMTFVDVIRYSNPFGRQCGSVEVEEHTACGLACRVTPDDCSSLQVYNSSKCKCECKNIEMRYECIKNKRKLWNAEKCSCVCKRNEIECMIGMTWDEDHCRCLIIYGDRN